jgi:hypothetical protein
MFGEEFHGDESLGIVRIDVIAQGMMDHSQWLDRDIESRKEANKLNREGQNRYVAKHGKTSRKKILEKLDAD